MRTLMTGVVAFGISAGLLVVLAGRPRSAAAEEPERLLAHILFFSLKDNSDAGKKQQVALCKKYLTRHEGTVFFTVGTAADGFGGRNVDRDHEVGVQLVFKSKAMYDLYWQSPRRKQFVAESKGLWKGMRIFNYHVERGPEG